MSEAETILRIAARGDGITASGRHVPGTAPGDLVNADGSVIPGPHRIDPTCRHFGSCGGCELQQCDDAALADFVRERVVHAMASQGLEAGHIAPAHLSPPLSRRRAVLHAVNGGGRPLIGFRERGSHRTVDLQQCAVLLPELFAVVVASRALLARRQGKYAAEISLSATDQGADLAIKGLTMEGLAQTEAMLDFARATGLARLTIDQGFGPETVWEPEPVTVTLSGVPVSFPPGAFLQATADGERVLAEAARSWLGDCATIADLFAGLGTFSFALAGSSKVLAAEAARDAHLACKAAAGAARLPVHALHRDLFRNPLQPDELDRFSAILLDPPRAGAREQIACIAQSRVGRVVYISCNPSSWVRDAKLLAEAGFALEEVRPVGQFRWTTHVELASLFLRKG